MNDNTSNNKRIVKNTAFLYARMVLILLIGFYTSRVILQVLGASDYGISNVVAGFVALFSFLNATFSSTLQRFYNYEGGQRGEEGYTEVFSVGFRVHVALAVFVLILVEVIGIWYINKVMVLPAERLTAAHILFQFSVASMVVLIVQAPFSGAIIAMERMDFFAVVSIIDAVLRLGLIILLPYIPFDKLIIYGLIQLTISIIDITFYVVYSKKNFHFIKLKKGMEKRLLKEILSFSGWTLFGSFAFLAKGQGVNMLLNYFFGPVVNAARGLAHYCSGALNGFSNNIAMAFRPQLVGSYSLGNTKRTFSLLLTQSKICYCLVLMLAIPVILEIDLLLNVWLGKSVPQNTNLFAVLVILDSLVGVLNAPVTQVVYATGNVKAYQIGSAIVNILLIPTCWLFLYLGFDAWIVFVLTIVFSILCHIVCLIIMHNVFKYHYKDYIKRIVIPCLVMSLLVPILPYCLYIVMDDSFGRLIIICLASCIVTCSMLYLFFLSKAEKSYVIQFKNKIVEKLIRR